MDLRPFPPDLAATVASWATSPVEAAMWTGPSGDPLTAEVVRARGAQDDVRPHGLYDGDLLVAYGELWVDDEEEEVELARLVVDPARRHRGIGRVLVTALTVRARDHHPDVFLRVRPDNAAARRCYVAAGYLRVDAAREAEWNAAQPVPYVWFSAPDPG